VSGKIKNKKKRERERKGMKKMDKIIEKNLFMA
jgi:hypothetical protein